MRVIVSTATTTYTRIDEHVSWMRWKVKVLCQSQLHNVSWRGLLFPSFRATVERNNPCVWDLSAKPRSILLLYVLLPHNFALYNLLFPFCYSLSYGTNANELVYEVCVDQLSLCFAKSLGFKMEFATYPYGLKPSLDWFPCCIEFNDSQTFR